VLIAVIAVVIALSLQSSGSVQLQTGSWSKQFLSALQQLTNLINNNTS